MDSRARVFAVGVGFVALALVPALAAGLNQPFYLDLFRRIMLSGVVALLIGAVSLRTSGVSFIMITLAFAQMLYYLGISINAWGADDGMRLARRSEFGVINLANGYVFYY